jgi:hypothetical protein
MRRFGWVFVATVTERVQCLCFRALHGWYAVR